jgi:hypothetical protein
MLEILEQLFYSFLFLFYNYFLCLRIICLFTLLILCFYSLQLFLPIFLKLFNLLLESPLIIFAHILTPKLLIKLFELSIDR